jgi:hypothetical protein
LSRNLGKDLKTGSTGCPETSGSRNLCKDFEMRLSRNVGKDLRTGPTGCPEMSVVIYRYSLCNSPEERSSQPLPSRSLCHAELQTPWSRGCNVLCLREWFPTFGRIAVPSSHRTWILNLKQILLGDVASGMLQPLNNFQGLSIHTTHSC